MDIILFYFVFCVANLTNFILIMIMIMYGTVYIGECGYIVTSSRS